MLDLISKKKHIGILSFKEEDSDGFTSFKRGELDVDPGPYYLVWTKFSNKDKAEYGDILKWPYQLTEINLIMK